MVTVTYFDQTFRCLRSGLLEVSQDGETFVKATPGTADMHDGHLGIIADTIQRLSAALPKEKTSLPKSQEVEVNKVLNLAEPV